MRKDRNLARNHVIRRDVQTFRVWLGIGEYEAGNAIGKRRFTDAFRPPNQKRVRQSACIPACENFFFCLSVAHERRAFTRMWCAGKPVAFFAVVARFHPTARGSCEPRSGRSKRSETTIQMRTAKISEVTLASIRAQR